MSRHVAVVVSAGRAAKYLCVTISSVLAAFAAPEVAVYLPAGSGTGAPPPVLRPDGQACASAAEVRLVTFPDVGPLGNFRAVVRAAVGLNASSLLALEDDVVLAASFAESLEGLLAVAGEGPLVLSLYDGFCCGDPDEIAAGAASEIEQRPSGELVARDAWAWGSQALLFQGSDTLEELDLFFENRSEPLLDTFLLEFARDRAVPVWGLGGTHTSLVQHVGASDEEQFHWSFWFDGGTGDVSADAERLISAELERDAVLATVRSLQRAAIVPACALVLFICSAAARSSRAVRLAVPHRRRD